MTQDEETIMTGETPHRSTDSKQGDDREQIDKHMAMAPHHIQLPPKTRFALRSDGGMDDTYRVRFLGQVEPAEMRRIVYTLLTGVDDATVIGIVALTKVEFIEPDICEYRLRCTNGQSARLNKEFELLARLNRIHAIKDVDGIKYSFLGPQPQE